MRPTVDVGSGRKSENRIASGAQCIAKRCGVVGFYQVLRLLVPSGGRPSAISRALTPPSVADLSLRDIRTQPGGLTPGTEPNNDPPPVRMNSATRFRKSGLSLIELLVVLTIIAAISALITTSV